MIAFHILAFYALIQCTFSGSGKTHAVATRFKIDASWAKVLDVKPPQTIITLGPIYNFSKITGEEMCDLILERISLAKKANRRLQTNDGRQFFFWAFDSEYQRQA